MQESIYHISDISNIKFNIYDEYTESYSIGDLLNMPYFFSGWKNTPHLNDDLYNMFKKRAAIFTGSILNIYDSTRIDETEPIPNIQRIKDSVDTYIEQNKNSENLKQLFQICTDENTLVVHLRSGDKVKVEHIFLREDEFIQKINHLSEKYERVLILCGIHNNNDKTLPNMNESIVNLNKTLQKLQNNSKVYVDVNYPDIHLSIMRKAKNLLIHSGGFSVLGSIIFTGNNLYLTEMAYPVGFARYYNHDTNGYFNIIPPCIII